MRRFAIPLITLALVMSAAGAAPAAHAAPVCQSGCVSGSIEGVEQCVFSDNTTKSCDTSPDVVAATKAASEKNAQAITDEASAKIPNSFSIANEALASVMTFIMGLFAWLLGVAMVTLDTTMFYTVVTMGNYVHNLGAVEVTWRILRDIGNIALIFGFLAVGISVILNSEWYGGGKKMLPMLLVAAVFLNFSLFISEAVIDTGNLFATQFYTQINGGNPAGGKKFALHEPVSDAIMSALKLQGIYGAALKPDNGLLKANSIGFIGFMSVILFIIAAFVMFSLAFILIARFVMLLFLIILSPVGFAGLAVPQLKGTADKWWSTLFEQTITAPVLLLLLYIALRIITDASFLEFGPVGDYNYTSSLPTENNPANLAAFAGTMLSFIIAMGLLLAVTIFSKRLSAFGAGWATKTAGKLSFGATAWAGRATVGTMIGRGLLGNRFIKRGAVSDNKFIKYGSRALSFTGKRLQNRTFDVRNMPGAGKGLGMVGVEAGTASTLTAKQLQEKQYGAKPVKEFFRQSSIEHEQAAEELKRKAAFAGTNNDEIARTLSRMTTKEIEELGGIKNGVEKLVSNLSPQQFESLLKSDKLTEVEKGRIKAARYRPLSNAVAAGVPADVKKVINTLSKGELESIPAEILSDVNVLESLSDKQRETLMDSKERTATERNAVRNSSASGKVETAFSNPLLGPTAASMMIKKLTPQQVSKIKPEVLTNKWVSYQLTPAMLGAIMRENKLIPADAASIKANIMTGGLPGSKTYLTKGPAAQLWS